MKALISITSALVLCSSLAMAATVKAPQIDQTVKAPVSVQLQSGEKTPAPVKLCPNGSLEVAGKCHEKAEPCMNNSECCSKNCMGGACY